MARQQIHHHAVVAWVEVLHYDEGHAVDRRKRVQELPAGVEAAGRGPDRDDRKTGATADGGELGYPARSLRPNRMLEASRHSATFLEEQRPRNGQRSIAEFGSDYELFRRRVLSVSVNASSGHA